MGLFDDILNKPSSSSSSSSSASQGGSSGGNPSDPLAGTKTQSPAFIIEKSEAHSIFDTTPTEIITPTPNTLVESEESIVNFTLPKEEALPEIMQVASAETTKVTEETPISNSDSFNLFGSIEETPKPDEIKEGLDTQEEIEDISSTEKKDIHFSHPKEFIESSIAEIDSMILSIQMAHTAKIKEAEAYGTEKDHQANLETEAYEAAKIMEEEEQHAERMREILTKELSTKGAVNENSQTEPTGESMITAVPPENPIPSSLIESVGTESISTPEGESPLPISTPTENSIIIPIPVGPAANDENILVVRPSSEALAA